MSAFDTRLLLAPPPMATFADFFSAALRASGRGDNAITSMQRALKRGAADLDHYVAAKRGLIVDLERALERGEPADMDSLIAGALAGERAVDQDYRAYVRVCRDLARLVARLDPKFHADARPLFARYADIVADFLNGLRDARWDLMALQARHQAEKVAPPLRTAKDVRRHLAGLR